MRLLPLAALLLSGVAMAQAQAPSRSALRVLVRDERTHQPLPGATVAVPALKIGAVTDAAGRATLPDLPAGRHEVQFSSLGYAGRARTFTLPQPVPADEDDADDGRAVVELEPSSLALGGVVVEATRTNSRIENQALRVEVLGEEEVNEELAMRPADISKLLTETAGIQPQFTSANSGSVAFRLQGLDGRYVQLLRDGFPLYGGFAQGLSLVQIPPLDLRQVEIIKGASSALYGGDAIAGLINLVSRTPTAAPALNALLSQTQRGGRDLSAFYTGRAGRFGLTLLALQTTQAARDVSGDDFTDLPQVQGSTISPRIYFYYSDSTTIYAGLNATVETRAGGYLPALDNPAMPGYVERNRSERYSTQALLDSHRGGGRVLTLKNSVSSFTRRLAAGSGYFAGRQLSTYSEASWLLPAGRHRAVLGGNVLTDSFTETDGAPGQAPRDYAYQTFGLFAQDDWRAVENLTLQAGLRTDYQRPYGLFVLPRVSALYRAADWLSVRAGGGFGYKAPTIFSNATEQLAYVGVRPLDPARLQAETAGGLTADCTLRGRLDELSFSLNQAAFYTRLDHPLLADPAQLAQGFTELRNAPGPVTTRGLETNIHLQMDEWQLFAAYTLTDTRQTYDPTQPAVLPFVSRHRVALTSTYEVEDNSRLGLEGSVQWLPVPGRGRAAGPRLLAAGRPRPEGFRSALRPGAQRREFPRCAPNAV